MEMYQNLGNFLDNYGSPFFVGSLVEKKLLFVNKEAKRMFDCTEETCDFEKIFERTEERLESLIERGLQTGKNSIFYNFIVNTGKQEKIVVDFQFGFFNDEKTEMFLEILPQQDTRLQMAKNQIQNSPRAEAILNFDENLSIVYCNDSFYKVFECNEELCHSHCKHDLVNGFLPETRESLMGKIQETLKTSEIFSTETKVLTANGEEKWYRFDLQKRELDNSGMKLMCYMVDIEKQVELKEENYLLIQQLSAMQELTDDVLYHIDVDKDIFYHNVDFVRGKDKGKTFTNFEDFFIEREIVHPEDTEKYQIYLKNWLSPDISTMECTLRFSITSMEYQWYTIRRKKICDENGVLMYILGALFNVQKEYAFQKENKTLNQYFDVLQTIPHESFYSVDVKNKTLTQTGKVAEELGLPEQTPNFPESVLYKVHPDDLEKYKNYSYSSMQGKSGQEDVRVQTKTGEYQWYRLQCEVVPDENGNITQVVGKMNNIHEEMTMQDRVSTLHKYLDVLNDISGESLYIYDIKTDKLRLSGLAESELGLPTEVENFPDSIFEWVHPDDLQLLRTFDGQALKSEQNRTEVRLKNVDGQYQWYELLSDIIHDDDGNQAEIFGRIKNVQSKYKLESEMEEANNYLLVMQELSDDIIYRIDVETKTLVYTTKSKNGEILTNTFENYPESIYGQDLTHPEDEKILQEQTIQWLSGNMQQYKLRMKLETEDYEWYLDNAINIRDKEGKVTEIYGRLQNIHAAQTMEADFSTLNKHFLAMQEVSDDYLFQIDIVENTFYQSNKVADGIGIMLKTENYVDTFITNGNIHPDDVEHYRKCNEKLKAGELTQYEMRAEVEKGVYHAFDVKCNMIYSDIGEPIEIFGRMKNIQAQKDLESRASHDLMTQVLNKVSFEDETHRVISESLPNEKHAVIFIDLDDFKGVNDTLGHSFGDALLTTVGKRLKRLVRGDDLVGRIGGDEFAVMLRNIDSEESVILRTELMLKTLQQDFSFEKKVVGIKASVGVSVYPQHGASYKELIEKADKAVYQSKRRGKNVVSLYTKELDDG